MGLQPSEVAMLTMDAISVLLGEDGGKEILTFADTKALNKFLQAHGRS